MSLIDFVPTISIDLRVYLGSMQSFKKVNHAQHSMRSQKIKVFETLAKYAFANYRDEFENVIADCPYETRMGGTRALRQELSWFIYEWKKPNTNKTILDEYIQKNILKYKNSQKNLKVASRLRLRENIIYDEFEVVSDKSANHKNEAGQLLVEVRAKSTDEKYVMTASRESDRFTKGSKFVGRIHPRDEKTYMVCGVLTRPGEWDDAQEEKMLEKKLAEGSISDTALKVTKIAIKSQSESRIGSGRNTSIEDIAEKVDAIMEPDSATKNPLDVFGKDMMEEFVVGRKKEKAAFEAAMATPIQLKMNLKQVLQNYPGHLLEKICQELSIKTLPSKNMMIMRIADELPRMVCDNLYNMSVSEQNALAHVLYKGYMQHPKCNHELSMRMGEDGEAEGFVGYYVMTGLIIVGTAVINGHRQRIITVASDIKELILQCPGWSQFVKSDGKIRKVRSEFVDGQYASQYTELN